MTDFFKIFPSQPILGLAGEPSPAPIPDPLTLKETAYVVDYSDPAEQACKKYGVNAVAILAQGSLESDWGTSGISRACHNFFGITAAGEPNDYWKGGKYQSKASGLFFRVYPNPLAGFLDFARLISEKYQEAARVSDDIVRYATLISQSPYISEKNGDSRPAYRDGIIARAKIIARLKEEGQPKPTV